MDFSAIPVAVSRTAEAVPESQCEYVLNPIVVQVSAPQASPRLWMEWIAEICSMQDHL